MRICVSCGKTDDEVFFESRHRKTGAIYYYNKCSACQWKRRTSLRHGTAKPKVQHTAVKFGRNTMVTVVSCPHDEYTEGAEFFSSDFLTTLAGGCWTLGMVVEANGKRYVVCGNGVYMRTLKKLGYPDGVAMPRQWIEATKLATDEFAK